MSNEVKVDDDALACMLIDLAGCDLQIARIAANGASVPDLRAALEAEKRVIQRLRCYAHDYLRVRTESAREKAAIALAKTQAPAATSEACVG